jgi:DNA-binding NarL/FixJ family response regulator
LPTTHRLRHEVPRPPVRAVPPPRPFGRVRGDGGRPGHRQEARREAGQQRMGGIVTRGRRHVLRRVAAGSRRRTRPRWTSKWFGTGSSYSSACAGGAPDVVLLDYRFPDTDGVDVLVQLARTPRWERVVMVTGCGDAALVLRALRLGAVDYVSKRDDYLGDLIETVRRVRAAAKTDPRFGLPAQPGPRRVLLVAATKRTSTRRSRTSARQRRTLRSRSPTRSKQRWPCSLGATRSTLPYSTWGSRALSGLDFPRQLSSRGSPSPVVLVTG